MNEQNAKGPIARRVLETLRRQMRLKITDLAAFRAGQEYAAALQKTVTSSEELAEAHPAHAVYIHAQNQMSVMAEQLLQMPELKSFAKQIGIAEDAYMPSWPPMSPISTSYFMCWSTFDLHIGARRETVGTITIAVAKECGSHPSLVALMQRLQDSRMGIYRVEGQDGMQVQLRDLATGNALQAVCASGYAGRAGELWYARVLPPPLPDTEHVVMTSPYVLIAPDAKGWLAYLDRTAAAAAHAPRADILEQHLKWGPAPRYWPEFIFEAYSRHQPGAIFLYGLPDIAETRPHSSRFRPPG